MSIGGDRQDPESDASDSARLDRLGARLDAVHAEQAPPKGQANVSGAAGYALGNQVISLLIGGLLGGAIVGGTIDYFAATSPWGLMVLMFLGTAAAFRRILQLANQRPE